MFCIYVNVYSQLAWRNATAFGRSLLPDKEMDATVREIVREIRRKLGAPGTPADANVYRKFLLFLPPPAPSQGVVIRARYATSKEGETPVQFPVQLSISISKAARRGGRYRVPFAGDFEDTEIRLLSPSVLAAVLPEILRFIAMRYKDIVVLEIGNSSSLQEFDCFGEISLKNLLRPFAEAGHWKTSLKSLVIRDENLWLDDDATDLPSYPEMVEVVINDFRHDGKNDAKSTLFQIMAKSNCLTRPDAFGHCGKLTPRAVHWYCEMLLKHTPFRQDYSRGPHTHHIVLWGEFHLYVSAQNQAEVEATLKTGEFFDSGVDRLFSDDGRDAREMRTLAMAYHYSALRRFRSLARRVRDDDGDGDVHNESTFKKKHLLVPMFLAGLQTNHIGGSTRNERAFERNLLFSILREHPVEFADLSSRKKVARDY